MQREIHSLALPILCPADLLSNSSYTDILICGIDEAGRGPLAGPVSAAAVILPYNFPLDLLNDSKKIIAHRREEIKNEIIKSSLAWGIGWADASEIDEINILKASLLAMKRAYIALENNFNEVVASRKINAIIDGLYTPDIDIPCSPLVKADSKVPAVMAASIMAKTARDRIMDYYAIFFPNYSFTKHKGYPTKAHREEIMLYGSSPIHRKSFSVKKT